MNGALHLIFLVQIHSAGFWIKSNPLAEMTHKRRISSMGPGGVSQRIAQLAIRSIHQHTMGVTE
jgi:DNA-directed RNA polymerase subunit beta